MAGLLQPVVAAAERAAATCCLQDFGTQLSLLQAHIQRDSVKVCSLHSVHLSMLAVAGMCTGPGRAAPLWRHSTCSTPSALLIALRGQSLTTATPMFHAGAGA
jgi:hypothetical protein